MATTRQGPALVDPWRALLVLVHQHGEAEYSFGLSVGRGAPAGKAVCERLRDEISRAVLALKAAP